MVRFCISIRFGSWEDESVCQYRVIGLSGLEKAKELKGKRAKGQKGMNEFWSKFEIINMQVGGWEKFQLVG